MKSIRCSALPRVLACPQSLRPPTHLIETADDEAARLGSAAHALIATMIRGQNPWELMDFTVKVWNVDAGELGRLVGLAKNVWEYLSPNLPNPVVEQSMARRDEANGIVLTGTPDVYAVVDDEVRVPDFKTGRIIGDHAEQVRGYMYLVLNTQPAAAHATTAWGASVHVRQREVGTPVVMTRGDLDDWYADFVRRIDEDAYRPSHDACQYCPRRLECEPRYLMIREGIAMLGGGEFSMGAVSDADLLLSVKAAKAIKGVCDDFLAAAKSEVMIRGTRSEDGDAVGIPGLRVVSQDKRELTPEAWPVLVQALGLERVQQCATLGVSKVEAAIKEAQPHGSKASAVAAVMAELDDAGGIALKTVEKLEIVG